MNYHNAKYVASCGTSKQLPESVRPEVSFAICLTKADKLSKPQQMKQAAAIRKQLKLPKDVPFVVTSAEKGTGIDDLRSLIASYLEE